MSGPRSQPNAPRFRALAIAVLALILATALPACGSDPEPELPGDADSEATAVIDDWATRLTEGDVEAAAALFATPSVAENGVAVTIEDADEAQLFNESLPCGAELIEASAEGEFTVATFRLTERPGPGRCGGGSGSTASTEFLIEDGLIVEWRRVIEEPTPQAPSSAI